MVAWRSLTDDEPVDPRDLMLAEQRERVRRGLCLVCGKQRHLCDCGTYEHPYDPHAYAGPGEEDA